MSEQESTRRNFLKLIGLSAGASMLSANAAANFIEHKDILRLNSIQQEFMIRYGKWMDEFIEVIRVQKTDPNHLENNKKMMALSERAEGFKPELSEFMKDPNFAVIYQASIERMSKEI